MTCSCKDVFYDTKSWLISLKKVAAAEAVAETAAVAVSI